MFTDMAEHVVEQFGSETVSADRHHKAWRTLAAYWPRDYVPAALLGRSPRGQKPREGARKGGQVAAGQSPKQALLQGLRAKVGA
jgi:hypothetical protein